MNPTPITDHGRIIQVFVPGAPVAKGSVRAWKHPKTGAVIKRDEHAEEFAAWAGRVAAFTRQVTTLSFGAEPVIVKAIFRVQRPKGHFGAKGLKPKAPYWPAKKPDVDKLLRAALDALTGVLFDDDAQVISVEGCKFYANPPEFPVGTTLTVKHT